MVSNVVKRYLVLLAAVVITGLVATSCATQGTDAVEDPAGFLYGLLHGFIVLFSFVGSLFTDFKIYAYPNAGAWYDFGYLLGVMMFFGGGGANARKRKSASA